ncbi:YkgJ family cysteine cluster protein [candidate division WOR-3 bacterium]|nr:YkgJ family cysteine cluster protein [candidate division WOR-3 bacterium]
MQIETDLGRIRELASRRERENVEFRSRLKWCDISERRLDRIVHELHADVSKQIDCLACANCCREMSPALGPADVRRLAKTMQLTPAQFKRAFLKEAEADPGRFLFRAKPCPLLEGNRCSQYDSRPKVCAEFPFLHKPDFNHRTIMVMWNYGLCPIVFNVVERLKDEVRSIESERRLREFFR